MTVQRPRRRRIINAILLVLLALFLIPPAWSVLRDILLLTRADPERRQDARFIIQRDISRGSERVGEWNGVTGRSSQSPSGSPPVITPAMPPRDLTELLSECQAGLGETSSLRRLAVNDAIFRQVDDDASTIRLIALNACLSATPFAASCAGTYESMKRQVTEQQVIAQLLEMRALARRSGRLCWATRRAGDAYLDDLEVEATNWLIRSFPETGNGLVVRDVRSVGDGICGEATFEISGRRTEFRLFQFGSDGSGSVDLPGPRVILPDGRGCSVKDDILTRCAATPSERESAELRAMRCRSGS